LSSARARGALVAAVCAALVGAPGCWEQVSRDWFPQMKRQLADQAFEEITNPAGQIQGFTPPEGTVAVDWASWPDVTQLSIPEQEAIPNPVPPTLDSLKNGEVLFHRYCGACHGPGGGGDGPVAGAPFGKGPLGLVLPIGGPMSVARNLSDGHIFTTISMGRGRMPSYKRIPPESRWDVINYLRDLNGQGGRQ